MLQRLGDIAGSLWATLIILSTLDVEVSAVKFTFSTKEEAKSTKHHLEALERVYRLVHNELLWIASEKPLRIESMTKTAWLHSGPRRAAVTQFY